MDKKLIYTDNAATTRVAAEVLEAMLPYFRNEYGNASALYSLGQGSADALKTARAQVAKVLNADAAEIVFTGSGTEADNMALIGVMNSPVAKGKKHLITTVIEHPAMLRTAERLEKQGFSVTYLPVDGDGLISLSQLEEAICDDTALVSIMFANNEIGTIQPIAEIGALCKSKGVLFHTDAVQAFGAVPIDVKAMNIDLLSLSAHKINGPKGVGALYLKKGIALRPVVFGGGQERGLRGGTENIPGIVGLGHAAQLRADNLEEYSQKMTALRDRLIDGVLTAIPKVQLTGHKDKRLPAIASFVIEAIEGESLLLMLDMAGICASTGSACSTGSLDPSHVLMGIGLKHEVAHGSLRLSLGGYNTVEEIDYIIETLPGIVTKLRAMSPVWNG